MCNMIVLNNINIKTRLLITIKTGLICKYIQVRFACLRCAAGEHFVSAGGALWAPGVTLINYKGNNISKHVYPTVIIDIA